MVTLQTLYNDIKTLGLQMFQEKLVSGDNIKTINNNSILGTGDIAISGTVNDWETITVTTGTLMVNTTLKLAFFTIGQSVNITTANTWQTLTANNIPSTYRLASRVVVSPTNAHPNTDYVQIDTNGTVSVWGGSTGSRTFSCNLLWKYVDATPPIVYIINDTGSADNQSTLFGNSIALRNNGTNSTGWNSGGYYTVKNTGSQKESMRVLSQLTGETGNFVLEYDSYVEGANGSSGFVIYNSSTSWEKLTDDADSNKKYWYGYNNGSFHESAFYGNIVTNQKWVHYKYTVNGSTFTMEVTYDGSTVVTHSETIHLTRSSSTQYGLDSEWQSNTQTRYKNIQAYYL